MQCIIMYIYIYIYIDFSECILYYHYATIHISKSYNNVKFIITIYPVCLNNFI